MNPSLKRFILSPFSLLYRIAPHFEQKIMFRLKCGYKLNLEDPVTYNEKINWMKLFFRDEILTKCVDKFTVRDYIEKKGYGAFLPELYWEGFDPEDIPFDKLPQRFVIKVTSGSGYNIICKDKGRINRKETVSKLRRWLKQKYLLAYGEWFYGIEKPRVIVEEFLDNGTDPVPPDYKLFYFNNINGHPSVGCTAVDTGRFKHHVRNIYDAEWKFLPDVNFGFDVDAHAIVSKPELYDEMVRCAVSLGKPFPHARIDFYVINNRFYIGEITMLNGAGYDTVQPLEFNKLMGSWIKLPGNINR